MNRALVLLALLAGAVLQFAVAPLLWDKPVVPAPATIVLKIIQVPPPSYHSLIRAMHSGRSDVPHLFTRFYAFWLSYMIQAQVYDTELAKPQPFLMIRYSLTLQAERVRQAYFDLGIASDMTPADWEEYRIAVELRGCKLVLIKWADMRSSIAGYMQTLNQIWLPENKLAPSGLPPRLVALHEFTHLIQHNLWRYGFAEAAEATEELHTDSSELAAMVVETAQLIHDGLTREQAEAMDLWHSPMTTTRPFEPRLAGGLAWDYVKRYGPHITGDIGIDLFTIERWVKGFEVMSRRSAVDDFIAPARQAIENGETTHLAAACQTFLAINGEPSWFPMVAGDLDEGPPQTVDSADILSSVPPERRAAVEDFLIRIDGP